MTKKCADLGLDFGDSVNTRRTGQRVRVRYSSSFSLTLLLDGQRTLFSTDRGRSSRQTEDTLLGGQDRGLGLGIGSIAIHLV